MIETEARIQYTALLSIVNEPEGFELKGRASSSRRVARLLWGISSGPPLGATSDVAVPGSTNDIRKGFRPLDNASNILNFALVPKRVADVLSSDIVFGRLAPNSRLIEEDIAARFNVSRSPVRESIRVLERDGLVVREERRGARVSPLNRRNLDEVYVCRLALEGIAAAEAAARYQPSDLTRLNRGLTALRKAFQKKEIEGFFEANVSFTEAVHEAADNGTLTRLLGSLGKQALRYRYLAYRSFPQLMATSVDGNEKIVKAISQRDKEQARALTEDLIERSWQAIRNCVPE